MLQHDGFDADHISHLLGKLTSSVVACLHAHKPGILAVPACPPCKAPSHPEVYHIFTDTPAFALHHPCLLLTPHPTLPRRHDRPSHALTPKQLTREILDTHKVISTARQAALTAVTPGSDDPDSPHSMTPTVTGPRTKWFRPGWGWFTPELVEAVQKLGYHTVLGSVWPWDVYSKWPLLNALYISAKVYPGAVIVLHDRWVVLGGLYGKIKQQLVWVLEPFAALQGSQ